MRQLKISHSITSRESVSLNLYMKEVSKLEMITPEREAELSCIIQQGGCSAEAAVHELVTANLRFVISVAKQYQDLGISLSDLINEGNLGLIRAAWSFDASRGFKFITYAVWWVRQSILKALGDQGRTVRLPQNQVGNISKLRNATMDFEQRHHRQPSSEELAEILDMDAAKVMDIQNIDTSEFSIDKPVGDDSSTTIGELMESNGAEEMVHNIRQEDLRVELSRALHAIPERERMVLIRTYGLFGHRVENLDEIGLELGLSRERVRQIRTKGESLLRKLIGDADLFDSYN